MTLRVSIVGASGYVGGELLRLLLWHPRVAVAQATSARNAGRYIHQLHPNLRGRTALQFVHPERLEPCDLLFLALPHGEAARAIERYAGLAPRLVDCSADFRLRDPAAYRRWYGEPHPAPEWLDRFVYGLPELRREALAGASYASGVGCNATATTLALLPLVRAGLVDVTRPVIVEVKVGSSEGGATASESSHHPERAGVVRSFAPVGHRHTAEVEQATGLANVHLSITSVELVRGALRADRPGAPGHPPPPRAEGPRRQQLRRRRLRARRGHRPHRQHLRHRQPHEGRGRQRRAVHEPHVRLRRDGGAGVPGPAPVASACRGGRSPGGCAMIASSTAGRRPGMTDEELEALLREITGRIRAVSDPEQIILFGSYARGDAGPDSDLDLLVVKETAGTARAEAGRIYRALSNIRIPVDIVVVRPADLARYRDLHGTIIRPALHEGTVLYVR